MGHSLNKLLSSAARITYKLKHLFSPDVGEIVLISGPCKLRTGSIARYPICFSQCKIGCDGKLARIKSIRPLLTKHGMDRYGSLYDMSMLELFFWTPVYEIKYLEPVAVCGIVYKHQISKVETNKQNFLTLSGQ